MKKKFLIAAIASTFWVLLIPLWIGWVSFFGILSTLLLFYPHLAPTLAIIFLFSFFYRKKHTTMNTIAVSGIVGVIFTLYMLFQMRSFLEPGLFSMEQEDFVVMGLIYLLLILLMIMLGNFLRILIIKWGIKK